MRPVPVVAVCLLSFVAAARAQSPALRGLDPVALCGGKEAAGKPELQTARGDCVYQFATEASRATFLANPDRYEIQLGGACARMGPLSGLGDPDRWHVHRERIYIFASDQCREGFKKRPDAFLDVTEPMPTPAAPAMQAASALLARAAASHGGKERLQSLRSFRDERTVITGDMTEFFRRTVQWPTNVRIDHDYRQQEKAWRYAQIVTADRALFLDDGNPRSMSADARTELLRDQSHEPLLALRAALDGHATLTSAGQRDVLGIPVEEIAVWQHGRTTFFGIGKDGRIHTARFRGRGPGQFFGAVELCFDGFQEHGGVVVPSLVRGAFDGKELAAFAEQRTRIEVDGAIEAESFAPK